MSVLICWPFKGQRSYWASLPPPPLAVAAGAFPLGRLITREETAMSAVGTASPYLHYPGDSHSSRALRLPPASLKPDAFKDQLRELCIPQDLVTDLSSVVFGSQRLLLNSVARRRGTWLPHVASLWWRVDVAISTSALARSLQPSVLMQLKLSDGSAYRFEVPTAKFQELRYGVALVLKEMADLEKRCELRLQD
ncbi:COMM domain-containing protein 5 isoform X3 [Panthera uncia]|uniref:COMM domain-containing protein 5 isoform X3 n=1 Tax=Panthera uncia TaxID=29064 RepID=UPI0020FFB7BA|nr:COMM domain-containing protein 5 isoform X3 [Panthera uncia]